MISAIYPPPAGYIVFRDQLGPKIGAGEARHYWQGPDSRTWGAGPTWRDTAPAFPDQHAARAAVAGDYPETELGDVGYEWRPATVEQLALVPAAVLEDGATR